MALQVGDKAPLFSLVNSEKETVNLADYAGRNVVVLFFPLAFTGVCTAELCQMRDEKEDYAAMDADILGISIDSPFVLEEFKKQQNYNFPLLSDFNRDVSMAYDVLYDTFVLNMNKVSKRSAFVVDKNGVVKYAEVLNNAGEMPNFAAIKETLSQLN
jgi:glutaredoxin-dependent peroxiredoxin